MGFIAAETLIVILCSTAYLVYCRPSKSGLQQAQKLMESLWSRLTNNEDMSTSRAQMLRDARQQQRVLMARGLVACLPHVIFGNILVRIGLAQVFGDTGHLFNVMVLSVSLAITLLLRARVMPLTSLSLDVAAACGQAMMVVNMLRLPEAESHRLVTSMGAQQLWMLILGNSFADARKAIVSCLPLFVTRHCKLHYYNFNVLLVPSNPGFRTTQQTIIMAEVMSLILMSFIFVLTQQAMEFCISSSLHLQAAENHAKSAKSLLSVLCDADAVLDHDLQIVQPDNKTCHVLAPTKTPAAFGGVPFSSFLVAEERAAFQNWIGSGADSRSDDGAVSTKTESSRSDGIDSGEWKPSPPKSFNAHLQEGGIAVALFHVQMSDHSLHANSPSHLLGIRFQSSPEEFGPSKIEKLQQRLLDSAQAGAMDMGPLLRSVAKSPGPLSAASARSKRSNSSASSASSSLQASCQALPEVDFISVSFDCMTSEFPVQSARVQFNLSECNPDMFPSLQAWILPKSWCSFNEWVRDAVNFIMNEEPVGEEPCTPSNCNMVCPFHPEMTLSAKNFTLSLADGQEADADADAEAKYSCSDELSPSDAIVATITFRAFSQYRSVRHSRRSKRLQHLLPSGPFESSLKPIGESQT
eukprot:TRINITY_DN9401_c0_g1_i1.p1 TRINITY_DN9401_c0_g1~~TRINITY_DN9401_c0_g1_i1.p1  ORF type:complete len:638 (+),score=87.59 TRINITY_DN9401_c0_g1_i1:58-1971(+)